MRGKDAGNVYGISRRGADTIEMRNELGANRSIGEVAFHHAELGLGIVFPLVKLDTLAFYCLELALMCPIPIDVSNNTRVFEIYNGIVDKESGGGEGVKDVEVVILDPGVIEIRRGMCMCVEGNGVLRVTLLANSYDVSIDSNLSESDISCYFVLPILIEEDKRVLLCITAIVLTPSETWMIWVVYLYAELGNVGDGTGCGREGDSGVVCGEPNWFVVLDVLIQHVTLDFVKYLGNKKEMLNGGVITESSGEDLIIELCIPQNVDCWEEILRPS